MSRGGFRENAGRKGGWRNTETKTIRVPKAFADHLLEIARILDSGEIIEIVTKSNQKNIESVTKSNLKNDSVSKSENNGDWMTTREVWENLGRPKTWNTFRNLKIQALRDLYRIEADPDKKRRGKTDARWLKFLPNEIDD